MEANENSEVLEKALAQAIEFHNAGKVTQAVELYGLLLQYWPNNPLLLRLFGAAEYQLGRPEQAVPLLERSIALEPGRAESYNDLANAQQGLRRFEEAIANYDRALTSFPDYAEALANRSVALNELKRCDEALRDIDRALALTPGSAIAHNCRGNVLYRLGRIQDARAGYEHAIALAPQYAEAHTNLGNVLREQTLYDEALASYGRALAIAPNYALALNNRGNVFQNLRRFDEALADYNRALDLMPAYADAFNNLGNVLQQIRYGEAAIAAYDRALAIDSRLATTWHNKALALLELKRIEEALDCCTQALAIDPDCPFVLGDALHFKMQLCDWRSFDEDLAQLVNGISQSKRLTLPFPFLGLIDSPALKSEAGRIYAEAKLPPRNALPQFKRRESAGKIRLGYYSADFHNHATAHLIAELFEQHDRAQFELYGFSYGPDQNDPMRQRLLGAFDRFIDITGTSDCETARLSRQLDIDIAVDLKGYTKDSRTGIFAWRAAPIQINFLGYPGTLAVDVIDYIIADKTVIASQFRSTFSENVIYLPYSYQPNDSHRKIATTRFSRSELGLPETGFVYCCFNNSYKILPATFESWMRILKATDHSVLWLLEDNGTAAGNLRKAAEASGVDGARLIFAPRMPLDEHLARHRLADLFIDTLPYNAHTTASDALWAGLPVLTRIGHSFAGRVAASLLTALDLPELITDTQEEYEATAIELANSPARISELRMKLERHRQTAPLFNGKIFAKHIESAYSAAFDRYRAGLPPADIEILP